MLYSQQKKIENSKKKRGFSFFCVTFVCYCILLYNGRFFVCIFFFVCLKRDKLQPKKNKLYKLFFSLFSCLNEKGSWQHTYTYCTRYFDGILSRLSFVCSMFLFFWLIEINVLVNRMKIFLCTGSVKQIYVSMMINQKEMRQSGLL